ncbi:hypothetical protein PMAYCL1PPCAC_05795, partial [Pristionchus mayeri]
HKTTWMLSSCKYISGPPFFVFNACVCLLIVLYGDPRGKAYRKYIFSLQFFSTLVDALMSGYAPIIQFNCRLMYAESLLMIYASCFFGVISTYFTCVYYRRNKLLPDNTLFCFHGWKYTLFLASVQVYIIVSISEIPEIIVWVKRKFTFLVISNTKINYPALICKN